MDTAQRLALKVGDPVTRTSNGRAFVVTRSEDWLGKEWVVRVRVLNANGLPWQRTHEISDTNCGEWVVS